MIYDRPFDLHSKQKCGFGRAISLLTCSCFEQLAWLFVKKNNVSSWAVGVVDRSGVHQTCKLTVAMVKRCVLLGNHTIRLYPFARSTCTFGLCSLLLQYRYGQNNAAPFLGTPVSSENWAIESR